MAANKNRNTGNGNTNINSSDMDTRSMSVRGDIVTVRLGVKRTEGAERSYNITAELDFSDIPTAQILVWAARTKVIDLQRALRLCTDAQLADLEKNTICRKATAAGASFGNTEKTKNLILAHAAALSAEDRAALLAALNNMN